MTSDTFDSRLWQRPDGAQPGPSRPGTASLVDPEDDDLPSASYSGDFETTAIPRYGDSSSSGHGSSPSSGYGLLGDPEPLPYVQPARSGGFGATPTVIGPDDFVEDRVREAGRRGTQDLGLLILRFAVGAVLLAHGLRDGFGLWGGPGIGGFAGALADLGFQHATVLAYAFSGVELVAGVLLLVGVFTPLAAAFALAYMVTMVIANLAAQRDDGFVTFFLPAGFEYMALMVLALSAVILSGPGRYGFDGGRGWARRPFVGSATALLAGLGAGVGLWALFGAGNPLA